MKNTTVSDQVSLMVTMIQDELKRYPPPVQGLVANERVVCEGKLGVLYHVLDILQEGFQEERNRHKEIWKHFLTILDVRKKEYKETDYIEGEDKIFPEEVLCALEKDYLLYLRSHNENVIPGEVVSENEVVEKIKD